MDAAKAARYIGQFVHEFPKTDREVLGDLIQPRDEGQDFVTGTNYNWWRMAGSVLRPRRIVEVGTRYGYSMRALTKGAGIPPPGYTLHCFDNESDSNTPEPLKVMEEYFRKLGFTDVNLHRVDTQTLGTLGIGSTMDLGVVDADHSYEGCLHDCELVYDALKPGGWMLIDDCLPGIVADATEKFCLDRNLEWAFLPSLRGIYLTRKPGAA